MPLTTFGAIMGFAAEMAGKNAEIYRALSRRAKDPVLQEVLRGLSVEEGKNQALMAKTRQENVTEMILEPVAGLRQEDYEIGLEVSDPMADPGVLKVAVALEERGKKFFGDASAKVSLPEVARIFRKIALKKEENLRRLQSLSRG
jgi:rubrerythrin